MTSDLPSEHVHLVKFEAFCEEPRTQLARLCGFLGIEFSESMLRRPETGVVHSIGGSPSKFDASRREIQLDRSYENAFSVEDQVKMRAVIGSEAERWGY